MKVLIIEDELLTAKDLERTIKAVENEIEILAIVQTVEDAVKYLKSNENIDLIFADIQLGNQLSFEIFKKVKSNIPVIFCTAYDEYALQAFKANGIDYLLKPFKKNDISKALEKYQSLQQKFENKSADLGRVLEKVGEKIKEGRSSVVVYVGDRIIPIELRDIALFYVENKLTFAYTFDSKQHVINEKLDLLEAAHKPIFFRANRQFLVNRKAIKDASQYFHRKLLINLKVPFKEQIIVSKLRTSEFIDWLTIV